MYKFFVQENQIKEDKIQIIGEDVNHIKNVLRLKKEDELQVCNLATGKTYIAKILSLDNTVIETVLIKECMENTETKTNLHIFQGLPKQEKMESIIQKATEIGVNEITPVKMEHCVVRLDEKSAKKKQERWQKIAEVAAKQSKRDKIPLVNSCIDLKNIYEKVINYDIVIVAYEEENQTSIKQVLKGLPQKEKRDIAILIGPEGGIAKKEIDFLRTLSNVKVVTLGKRILRTETAPIVLTSSIMYEFDEME